MDRRLTLLLIAVIPVAVTGHLGGGKHVSTQDHFIDIGHQPANLTSQEKTTMLLSIADKNGSQLPVDTVRVKIQDQQTVLAATLQANEAGSTSFNYVFPRPGTYTVQMTFSDNRTVVDETTTTLSVAPKPTRSWYGSLLPW